MHMCNNGLLYVYYQLHITLQAFDNVWHNGLFYKIKNSFPSDFYTVIKSYLLQS